MSVLENLVEKKVTRITNELGNTYPLNQNADIFSDDVKTELYVQIAIEDYTLNIYNPIKLIGTLSSDKVIGERIRSITEGNEQVTLIFESTRL